MWADDEIWRPGCTVGGLYEIKALIGEGGMGQVHLVRHREWDLDLAVKSPRRELTSKPERAELFVREAQTWVDLGLHPFTAYCHYIRAIDGLPRIFVEYVDGGSLADWIANSSVRGEGRVRAALDIAIQSAWGIGHAHEKGYIHQDIKPANILMTRAGAVKVADFGLARARAAGGAGVLRGRFFTPLYCSPEQARGLDITIATDVWSWGLCVLEMFAGGRIWVDGPPAPSDLAKGQLAARGLKAYLDHGPPRNDIPPMPNGLADLLSRCFRDDASSRPASMKDIASELTSLFREYTGSSFPREEPEPARLAADALNNRAVSMVDLGQHEQAMKFWREALRIRPNHVETIYNLGLTEWRSGRLDDEGLLRRIEQAAADEGQPSVCAYLKAWVNIERGNEDSAREVLKGFVGNAENAGVAAARAALDSGLRNCRRLVEKRGVHKKDITSICVSPDGSRLAVASRDGTASVVDVAESDSSSSVADALALSGHQNIVWACCFSPDGQRLWTASGDYSHEMGRPRNYAADNSVREWDLGNGASAVRLTDTRFAFVGLAAGKGDYPLAAATWSGIAVFDRDGGYHYLERTQLNDGTPFFHQVSSVVFSQDGRRLLAGYGLIHFPMLPRGGLFGISAISAQIQNRAEILDVTSGERIIAFEGHTGSVDCVAYSPDEMTVATGSLDGTVRVWDARSGNCMRVLESHASRILGVLFTAGGKHLISLDGNVRIWEIGTGRCLWTSPERATAGCCSADGGFLYVGCSNGEIRTWELHLDGEGRRAPLVLSRIAGGDSALNKAAAFGSAMAAAKLSFEEGAFGSCAQHLREAQAQPGFERSDEAFALWIKLYRHFPRGKLLSAWEERTLAPLNRTPLTMALSGDGRKFLCGTANGFSFYAERPPGDRGAQAAIWDLESGALVAAFATDNDVTAGAISADGATAIVSEYDRDRSHSYLLPEERRLAWLNHRRQVYALGLNHDSKYSVSIGDDRRCRIWKMASGECVVALGKRSAFKPYLNDAHAVSFTPDETGVIAIDGREIIIWEIATGRYKKIGGDSDTLMRGYLQIRYDARQILASDTRGPVILDTESGDPVPGLKVGKATYAAMTADWKVMVTGTEDGTVRIWSVESGECLRVLEAHSNAVTFVAITPDGRRVVSAGSEGEQIRVWNLQWTLGDAPAGAWDERARPILQAFLTRESAAHFSLTERARQPQWDDEDVAGLMETLGLCGFGHVGREAVLKELESMRHILPIPAGCSIPGILTEPPRPWSLLRLAGRAAAVLVITALAVLALHEIRKWSQPLPASPTVITAEAPRASEPATPGASAPSPGRETAIRLFVPVEILQDSSFFEFGKAFPISRAASVDRTNPNTYVAYALWLCKEGKTAELIQNSEQSYAELRTGPAFAHFVREFGPELERYRNARISATLAGFMADEDETIWYYTLTSATGEPLEGHPWVSARRVRSAGLVALTGIFLPEDGKQTEDMPPGLRTSRDGGSSPAY